MLIIVINIILIFYIFFLLTQISLAAKKIGHMLADNKEYFSDEEIKLLKKNLEILDFYDDEDLY